MENRTAVDGSFLGCIAQPVSQSTPGLFSEVLRATVQPPYRKLTPIEFNPEATLPTEDVPHSRSSKLLASAINTDLTEAASPTTYKDSLNACLKKTRKIQSLPTLNYMEKVGAWNVTQYTGQTFFDNLALKGFTGVSPKKKAFNAIADSLNNIFTQQRSEKSPTPSAFIVSNHSPRRTLAASFSGTSSPANDACGPTGGLKSSPIGRSMSYTSLSTASKEIQQAGASQSEKKEAFQAEVVHGMGCASATTGANSPEEGRKPGNQELQSSAQPPSLISLDRFSDLSPNHNFSSILASSQDTSCYGDRRRLASARAVSASSIVSLEVDNYAPYWVTNPSTPAKNKDLNIEERIPVYLHNLGIDQSPSTILNPFLASGPIREPEFSPTDLRTIKGSTGTPTRSTQPSEGDSLTKGEFSLSSLLSVNSSLSIAETFSLPEDRNQPLNESSLSRVAKHIRKFQSCELSVTPVSLSSTSLADDEHHTKTHEADNEEFAKVTDATPTRSLELGNDSFVGSKTLQEIRKLLGKADSLVSGRSSFSSPFASLRGSVNLASFLHNKSDSFQDYFSSSTENQQSLSSLLWKRSSSDSMLTLDGLRDDSFQGEIQPSKTPVTRSAIMTDHDRFSIDRNSVGNASKQITQESTRSSFPDKNVGRSEPEGCSEGTQDKVTPVLFPTVSSTEESQEERQGHIDLIQDVTSPKPKGSAVIGSVKESQTSDGKEGEKAMASDNSSVDSLAARVACVLKNESPATVASSVISEGDQEECKAQDWIKLKVAGQHHEPLELNVEDRQRIEEIKAELLLNTTGRKWSTDTDSDATSSLGLPEVQPSGKPAEELFALHTAKHQISSQMQKLTSNPFDTSVELHTPLRKDMDARIREIAQREEHPRPSATQQLAYEVRKPIASITFSSRKRSPSPSACPTGLLTPASEDHSPGRNFQMDAAKKRQASRSASNLTLEGNASASLENSAALLQISSFASGIPSVSSPTKKVLSYVHVTLSPKDPDGKSKSIEEKEFQFDSSLPRNEDGGAEMYQGRTGTLPAFPRLDPSGNPSEEKAQFPFQGHLSPDAAVSEEASNVRERRAADISKPLLEQGGSCEDPPMLLPYKPHGSPEIFYMPNTGGQVSTILSDTTMESSHTGSDDAVPPKFTVEIVGSKNKEVDIDVTTKHSEGIYIKRTQPRTVWKENKGEVEYSIEDLHVHCSLVGEHPTSSTAARSMTTRENSSYGSPAQLGYERTLDPGFQVSTNDSLQGSRTLDELWEKFKEKRSCSEPQNYSGSALPLLERLDRLSRLLHNSSHHSFTPGRQNEQSGSRVHGLQSSKNDEVKGRLRENGDRHFREALREIHIETGSTISTIDTARLVRAFGHRRVTVKPGLRKLYHTIDKQKGNLEMKRTSKQRESQRQKYRSAESPLLCRTESTRTLDSVSSTSTYSLPAQQGQSNTLKKKAVKLVSKGIQAGDLEIVNSGTKRHTRDVGMTFPSPGFSRGVQTAASRMGTKRDEHNESALQSFFNENKTRKSNLQQHPRGLSWFVPVDDLKSNAKKENQPSSRSGPGPVWFEPYTKNKPWREPLREKHVQEQPVSIRGRSMVQPITAPETNGKPPTSLIHITLQEALQMRHPEFVSRSRERLKRLELLAEERRMQAVFDSEREDLFNRPGTKKTWRASHPDRLHGEGKSSHYQLTKYQIDLKTISLPILNLLLELES
ncbi:ALMS1 protein, partial [Amia calva]|nr:ALMS1 protein [Amia calva]